MSIQDDIDRGLALVARMAQIKEQLKEITQRINRVALQGPQIPLEDAERDGMQYLARGSDKVVPVVITADYLAASFTDGSEKHTEVVNALPESHLLHKFYDSELTWKRRLEDGKEFRRHAREQLGDEAEAFIKACVSRDKHGIPKSAVKIDWDRAREVAS